MFGERLTSVLFLASSLLWAGGSQAAGASAGAAESRAQQIQVVVPSLSLDPPLLSSAARRCATARHIAWKSRLKSVLQETNSQIGEETDLGPAPTPDGTHSVLAIETLARALPARHPLRC
jgi:hypothetical protein